MRRAALLLIGVSVLAAGCGNPVHSHYSVSATAPCLTKLGYAVDTNADKLGVIESAAPEGALRASEPGNNVTIDYAKDSAGAAGIARAYHKFGPKRRREHISDVLETQHNVVLVWEITPPSAELNRVLGCLR